jgi:hypothetical protein
VSLEAQQLKTAGPGRTDAILVDRPLVASESDPRAEDDPILLPSPEERAWILAQLKSLVERGGYEHLVLAPLLEPDERFFPDPWTGDRASLRRLLRRLLVYADLSELEIALVVHDDKDVGGPVEPAGVGSLVWLVRKQNEVLHFAARASALKDAVQVVPASARAVAEAWRAHQGLTRTDLAQEQRSVDVTGVYLGFGILTTDACIRHYATRTDGFRVQRAKSRLGVLRPQALSFALACVATARGLDARARKSIGRRLQANPAGFFRAALDHLANADPAVAELVGVPPRERWATAPNLEALTAALPDDVDDGREDDEEEAPPAEDRGVLGMNEGAPVFRVERTKATRLAKMLGLPAVLLGVLFNRMQLGIEIEMWQAALAGAALALVGLIVGRFIPDVRCSEPKCGTVLSPSMQTCPRCRGTIRGVIRHPRERLAAEDALGAPE